MKNYSMEDLDDIYDYFSKEEVARYEDFYPMTKDEVRKQIIEWENDDSRLVAELKSSHVVIGSVGYFVDEDGDYSIDFDFNPTYGKLGYATEASKKLISYLFDNLGVTEIYGDCDIHNENSWRLLERLGFHRIKQSDVASYKDDKDGEAITISIYIYKLERNK